jgi:hypothetical protein
MRAPGWGEFGGGEDNRIALHAACVAGLLDDFGEVGGRDAVGAQRRYRECIGGVLEPRNSIFNASVRGVREQCGDGLVAL